MFPDRRQYTSFGFVKIISPLFLLCAGLALTGRARRLLRAATPVYVGALIGLCLSAVTLMGTDAPLIADNLLIYPGLGAAVGGAYALIRYWTRR